MKDSLDEVFEWARTKVRTKDILFRKFEGVV
jgi:hypothetical protein